MKAVEDSLFYRSVGDAYRWTARCASASLTGRALARAGRGLRPAFADSRSFGTGRVRPLPLDASPASPAASAFASPAFAVQGLLAGGPAGRGLHRLTAAAPLSGFAQGNWAYVLGAAVLGLGCGMVSSSLALGIVLLVVGLALSSAGPWVVTAVASSGIARLFGAPPAPAGRTAASPAVRSVVWAAMAAALAAGVLAGAGSHTRTVVALAAVIAVAAAILWRPQLVLLVAAAFPLVDWFARQYLGDFGPLWDEALLVVSVGLILWSVLVLGRDVPRSVPIALPLLLMFAAALGSVVVNRVPGGPALYGLRVLFQPVLFYFVGFLLPKDRRWVRWAVGAFVLAATVLALHGLYQFLTHAPMPVGWVDASESGISTRAYSVLGNPNLLGGLLAMATLISGSLALSRAVTGARRLALAAACVVQLGGLAVTFSRGAWIGFVIGLLATVVLAYRRYLVGLVLGAVVVWFAAPRVFIERLLFSFSSAYAAKRA